MMIPELYRLIHEKIVWSVVGWGLWFSPMLLILGYKFAPGLLTGPLLLPNDQNSHRSIAFISAAALVTSAFGIALIRIYDLYAEMRVNVAGAELELHNPKATRVLDYCWWRSDSTGWPILIWALWLVPALWLVLSMRSITNSELERAEISPSEWISGATMWRAFIIGFVCTSLGLFFISTIHGWIYKSYSSMCGLLPYEDFGMATVEWLTGAPGNSSSPHTTVERHARFPGFLDGKTNRVLPGHGQLLVVMVFASIAYVCLYLQSPSKNLWKTDYLPVSVYALLLFFLFGGVLGITKFILLRYHIGLSFAIPVACLLAIWIGPYLGLDSNRYFEIFRARAESNPGKATDEEQPVASKSTTEESGELSTFLAIAKQPEHAKSAQRKSLKEVYSQWNFPFDRNGKRTMVVVTASGGGIQAAAWTAQVLSEIDKVCPAFSESIGLVSGVSGGSVGAMYYLGHRGLRHNPPSESNKTNPPLLRLSDNQRKRIQASATASSLEAVAWGLAFSDMIRNIFPFSRSVSFEDRGLAIESSWWTRMGQSDSDWQAMKDLYLSDLIHSTNTGKIPPVIFNATAVETGQRAMISTFISNQERSPNEEIGLPGIDFERVMTPIDLLEFYKPLVKQDQLVDIRVSTAVRLSASFSYVTPVARAHILDDAKSDQFESYSQRLNYHFCDGGYADNTGIVAAIQVIADMIDDYKRNNVPAPFDQILFVSLESFPNTSVSIQNDVTGLASGFLGPINAMVNARVSSQAERAQIEKRLFERDDLFQQGSDDEILASFDTNLLKTLSNSAKEAIEVVNDLPETEIGRRSRDGIVRLLKALETQVAASKEAPDSKTSVLSEGQANQIKTTAGQFSNPDFWNKPDYANLSPNAKAAIEQVKVASREIAAAEIKTIKAVEQDASKKEFKPIAIHSLEIRFDTPTNNLDSPPLSWKLSPYDIARINQSWQKRAERIKLASDQKHSVQPKSAAAEDAPSTSDKKVRQIEELGNFFEMNVGNDK